VVHVTPFDMRRLARSQMLAPEAIVQAWPDPQPNRLGARLSAAAQTSRLVLRRSAAEPRACQFLVHLGANLKRCGVYAERPLVCAVYPFEVRNGSAEVRADARCGADGWNMASLDYPGLRQLLSRQRADWECTMVMNEVWNAAIDARRIVPDFEGYVRFASAVADAMRERLEGARALRERWSEALLPATFEREREALLRELRVCSEDLADGNKFQAR
jgi:Fe-S-cluster containining protein